MGIEKMLRMYLLQSWFTLSDPATEDAIYDSYAMRRFSGTDFMTESVPDETTLCKFRHLLEEHGLNKLFFEALNRIMAEKGYMMKGGTIVDATIINAPSSTKNAEKARDPEMHSTKKGNEWRFGMKCHIGVDAGSGLVHTMTVTGANTHDIMEAVNLIREDDEVVYGDAGYVGTQKRQENWTCDVAKLPLDPPASITMGLAIPSLDHASPAVKRFVKYVVQHLDKKLETP